MIGIDGDVFDWILNSPQATGPSATPWLPGSRPACAETVREALRRKRRNSLVGLQVLVIGEGEDSLVDLLGAAGADVTISELSADDALAAVRAISRQQRFDLLVCRAVLPSVREPHALLACFRELATTLCLEWPVDASGDRGPHVLARVLGSLGYHTFEQPMKIAGCRQANYWLAQRCDLPRENAPLLVHVHVPKNGGSSVNQALDRSFPDRQLPVYFEAPGLIHDPDNLARALYLRPDVSVLSSHDIKTFPSTLGNRVPLYVCFLRDPVDRHYSYYRYCRKDYAKLSDAHRRDWLPPNFLEMELSEFMEWSCEFHRKQLVTPNLQCHYFARVASSRRAISMLERFLFVGVTEQLDRGLQLLNSKLEDYGLDLQLPDSLRANVTATAAERLDQPEWKSSYGSIHEDRTLYRWALERFEREAEVYGV